MVSVEHAKWMELARDYILDNMAWNYILNHGGIHWASWLPLDCSGVYVFTRELFPPPTLLY